MKNIHLIETNKEPIRGDLLLRHLWKGDPKLECRSLWRYDDTIIIDNVKQYTTLNGSFRDVVSSFQVQDLYITNDESIKDGNYYINGNYVYKADRFYQKAEKDKKIILSTNPKLIADGVQEIDDAFLDWFCKNSICEYVEIEKYHGHKTSIAEMSFVGGDDRYDWKGIRDFRDYKIIIPSQEPKPHSFCETPILETEQPKYSTDIFDGYTHRFIVDFKTKENWTISNEINIYSDCGSFDKLEEFINQKKSDKVLSFDIICKKSKKQDDDYGKLIDELFNKNI